MAVRIEWGPLEAITNVRNEACKARDFIIQSHDGHVQGRLSCLTTPISSSWGHVKSGFSSC